MCRRLELFLPHLLAFLVHNADDFLHPWCLAGVDDTQSSATVHDEPVKVDGRDIRLQTTKRGKNEICICQCCLLVFYLHSSALFAAVPSILNWVTHNVSGGQTFVGGLQTAVNCHLTCKKMEIQKGQVYEILDIRRVSLGRWIYLWEEKTKLKNLKISHILQLLSKHINL